MKNIHKHLMSLLIVAFASALLLGSASTKAIPKMTFTFDHAPKGAAAPGSVGISLGFIKPYYADEYKDYNAIDLFKRYQAGLSGDVQELLLAKGFTMKEPYDNLADMTYTDKKAVQLILEIRILPNIDTKNLKAIGSGLLASALTGDKRVAYRFEGAISLGGRIELTAYEPMTREKLWAKSAELPPQDNIQVQTAHAYYSATVLGLMEEPGFYNPIGQGLQKSYETVLNKMENYIDVEELKALLPQIKELKSRKQ
jgi:hypothetical protein